MAYCTIRPVWNGIGFRCARNAGVAQRNSPEEQKMTPAKRKAAVTAVFAGMAVNVAGDAILGVRIENFQGMATFSPAWVADVFMVNFIVGLVVARIFGRHAKWLAIVPPFLVRCLSYVYLYFFQNHHGDFFLQLHLHYWGPTVILAVECANIGGILGEVLMGVYTRKQAPVSFGGAPARAVAAGAKPVPAKPTEAMPLGERETLAPRLWADSGAGR